eukprot:SAG31_NODE_12326_length_949_cov_1.681176_1_plen_68_part_00
MSVASHPDLARLYQAPGYGVLGVQHLVHRYSCPYICSLNTKFSSANRLNLIRRFYYAGHGTMETDIF